MFSALAAATAVRRRGLPSGSPPPLLAAMVISLIRRVKILPRLASSAPFLCLIVAHLEWPDMWIPSENQRFTQPVGAAASAVKAHEDKVDYSTISLLTLCSSLPSKRIHHCQQRRRQQNRPPERNQQRDHNRRKQ